LRNQKAAFGVIALPAKTKTAKRPSALKTAPKAAAKRTAPKADTRPAPRLRIAMGKGLILGPGKVDLLEAIERKGSISAAAREMDMSYRRAWLLVEALNQMFSKPVVISATGGAHGGGAQITEFGKEVAAAYRRIEQRTRTAIREELGRFAPDVDRS
jgi:molybdate transport system regulatory protein